MWGGLAERDVLVSRPTLCGGGGGGGGFVLAKMPEKTGCLVRCLEGVGKAVTDLEGE